MSEKKTIAWTGAQRAAIDHREGNLVVSASAGAGKTAVLAERVLSLLADASQGAAPRLDEMLVITFTERRPARCASGSRSGCASGCAPSPSRGRCGRALDSIGAAWIMTIDAFCRRVVVEHFHRAQLPPARARSGRLGAGRAGAGRDRARGRDLGRRRAGKEGGAGRAVDRARRRPAHGRRPRTRTDSFHGNARPAGKVARAGTRADRADARGPGLRRPAQRPRRPPRPARGAKELADACAASCAGQANRRRRRNACPMEGLADRLNPDAPDRPLACDALAAELEVYDEVLGKLTNQACAARSTKRR